MMKKTLNGIWTFLLILVPYVLQVLFLMVGLIMGENLLSERVVEEIRPNGKIMPIDWALLYYLLIFIGVIFFVVFSLKRRESSALILRMNMLIKFCHIPAYVLWFLIGILCMFTIYTMVFTVLIFILDCFFIFLSGMIATTGIIRATDEGKISKNMAIVLTIASFVFCLDLVAAKVVYGKTKQVQC